MVSGTATEGVKQPSANDCAVTRSSDQGGLYPGYSAQRPEARLTVGPVTNPWLQRGGDVVNNFMWLVVVYGVVTASMLLLEAVRWRWWSPTVRAMIDSLYLGGTAIIFATALMLHQFARRVPQQLATLEKTEVLQPGVRRMPQPFEESQPKRSKPGWWSKLLVWIDSWLPSCERARAQSLADQATPGQRPKKRRWCSMLVRIEGWRTAPPPGRPQEHLEGLLASNRRFILPAAVFVGQAFFLLAAIVGNDQWIGNISGFQLVILATTVAGMVGWLYLFLLFWVLVAVSWHLHRLDGLASIQPHPVATDRAGDLRPVGEIILWSAGPFGLVVFFPVAMLFIGVVAKEQIEKWPFFVFFGGLGLAAVIFIGAFVVLRPLLTMHRVMELHRAEDVQSSSSRLNVAYSEAKTPPTTADKRAELTNAEQLAKMVHDENPWPIRVGEITRRAVAAVFISFVPLLIGLVNYFISEL